MKQAQSVSSSAASSLGNFLLDYFDFFGQPPALRILEKKKFTSGLGCFMTIVVGTITLAFFITQIITLQEKSQPKVFYSQQQIFESAAFPLQNDNFTLAVSVTSPEGIPIKGQLRYYNISIQQCTRLRTVNATTNITQVTLNCTALPMDVCQESDFDNDLQKNFFKNTKLGVMQCLNREYIKKNPPVIQGQLAGTVYKFLTIFLSICRNSTTYQGCAPIEEQKQILQLGQYNVYASDYLMQLNNPDVPYQQLINMEFNSFSISTSKLIDWVYRIQETHTDDGLFFSNDNVYLNVQRQNIQFQSDIYNNNYLICHFIHLDYITTINQRSYVKMQTILSQVGGLWQIFIVVITTILYPVINSLMTIQIANQIYRFKTNKPEPQKTQNILTIEQQEAQTILQMNINLEDNEEKLSKNLFQSFLLLIGCYSEKKKLFSAAKIDIMDKLDIVKIIKKIQEIDLLKYILLSDEQLHLFELLPKPMIHGDNSLNQLIKSYDINLGKFNITSTTLKSKKKKMQEYLPSFEQVYNQQSQASVNEKLLQLMDKNVLSIFEQYQLLQQKKIDNLGCLSPLSKSEVILEPQIQMPR